MRHEIKLQYREPVLVLAKRLEVTLPTIGPALGAAFGDVYASHAAREANPDGPPFVIYHGVPEGDAPFEVEVCAPVRRAATEPPVGWRSAELPGGMFATLLHIGPYDSIGAGYTEMWSWIETQDLAVAGPPREVYLSDPSTPPEQIRTVIEFPVAEVAAAVR